MSTKEKRKIYYNKVVELWNPDTLDELVAMCGRRAKKLEKNGEEKRARAMRRRAMLALDRAIKQARLAEEYKTKKENGE